MIKSGYIYSRCVVVAEMSHKYILGGVCMESNMEQMVKVTVDTSPEELMQCGNSYCNTSND